MATKGKAGPFALADAMLHAHATNNRINVYLIQNLSDEAWNAKPPGGKGRSIASIMAHIHNVRLMWLKAAGAKELQPKLDSEPLPEKLARQALELSEAARDGLRGAGLTRR